MANNILASMLAGTSFVITNQKAGTVVSKNLKIKRVAFKFTSEVMRHTLEDGSTLVDARVVKPSKILVDCFCPDESALEEAVNLLKDRNTLFRISSRKLVLENFMIDAASAEQTPEVLSATPIRISFSQILIQNVSPANFENPSNASIVDRGVAAINTAEKNIQGLYSDVQNFVSNAATRVTAVING